MTGLRQSRRHSREAMRLRPGELRNADEHGSSPQARRTPQGGRAWERCLGYGHKKSATRKGRRWFVVSLFPWCILPWLGYRARFAFRVMFETFSNRLRLSVAAAAAQQAQSAEQQQGQRRGFRHGGTGYVIVTDGIMKITDSAQCQRCICGPV